MNSMKFVVTEKAVREYIREMMSTPSMGWQSTGDLSTSPVGVSSVVDPSSAETDPSNPNFVPSNRMELKSALSVAIENISDDESASFYKNLLDAVEDTKKEETEMKQNDSKVEEVVRMAVRKMLNEISPSYDFGMSYSEPAWSKKSSKSGLEECEACEGEGTLDDGTKCKVCMGKGELPASGRKNVTTDETGGSSFIDIAKEMGYATASGVKQAVDKALEKARFVAMMDQDDLEIITLNAMNDYIEMLKKSGELTSADVQLMKDHPSITSSLDGFREYLDKVLKDAQKSGQKVVDVREE